MRWLGKPGQLRGYFVAIVLVVVAFIGTALLKRQWPAPSFMFFVPAIALAAWQGGRGPTVLAAVFSFLLIDWFFLPPIGLGIAGPTSVLDSIAFFLLTGTIITAMEALRRARSRAEEHAVELETVALRASKLAELIAALSEARTTEHVTAVALRKGVGLLEASRGLLARTHDECVELVTTIGSPDLQLKTRHDALVTDLDTPVTESLRTRRPVWVHSADEFRQRFSKTFELLRTVSDPQAVVAVPLTYLDDTLGALSFSFDATAPFGLVDESFTLLLAQATAAALHRANGYDVERQRRRDAEMLSRTREEVLAVVAHDLRNPLNLISTTTQLLIEDTVTPPARAKLGATSLRAVKLMNRLIADLLDAARLQAGRLSLNLAELALANIVDQAEETFRPLAEAQRIEFKVDCPTREAIVRADPVRVSQVLGNLLGNALKFTPRQGTVTLRTGANPTRAVFQVVDTGPGIEPANLQHVFQDFWQARKGDGRGLGLGLAIAKALVVAHGGEIWVESTLGIGSTFSFTLPVRAQTSDATQMRSTAAAVA
jgi:signal transduction histidine kinase